MDRVNTPGVARAAEASNEYFARCFATKKVMAIIRGLAPGPTVELCERAWQVGIDLVEVTLQDVAASASLVEAATAAQSRGRAIGVGTVTRVEQVAEAARVGAHFTVAPGLDEEVAAASLEAGLAHLPGVATASEVQRAFRLGLRWLKVFPAAQLGPGWFRALLAPFPEARFVATGGVEANNAAGFLEAGAQAVAVGSALNDPGQLAALAHMIGGAPRPEGEP